MRINSLYSVASPDSLPARLGVYQRRRIFARFLSASGVRSDDTIIDVGATSDRAYAHSNHLEAWYPHKQKLTAVGIDDASFVEELYPGVTFRKADGRALPFPDCCFDFAHSNAVIEHVGSRSNQAQLLAEMWRVCRKGVFVTTPNRWFPVELHSILPLIHWLPAPMFRRTLEVLGHHELAEETNLNLMSRGDLLRAAGAAGISGARVEKVRFAGWTGNLLLIAHKPGFTAASRSMK